MFDNYLLLSGQQPHKHKIVIAGNHEIGFGVCDGYMERGTQERLWGATGAMAFFQQVISNRASKHTKLYYCTCSVLHVVYMNYAR